MKKVFSLMLALLTLFLCVSCQTKNEETEQTETVYLLRVDSAVKSYIVGDVFVEPSVVTLIEKNNGKISSQRILNAEEYEVDSSSYNSRETGEYEITVRYKEKNVSVNYMVMVKKESAKALILSGQRLRFYRGDEFETGNISVSAELSDGTVKVLERGQFNVDSGEYKKDEIGSYAITITVPDYDAETAYTVYVRDNAMPDYGTKINILGIGNSFTQDAFNHLYTILRGYGFEQITLVNLMKSNCDLHTHCENAKKNIAAYEFEKNVSGVWSTDKELRTLRYGLDFAQWDAIVLQQRSGYEGLPDTYGEDFGFLSSYVANYTANTSARIFWQLTWAYENGSTHNDFKNYDNDQLGMYRAIVATVKEVVVKSCYIDGVIPTGTAVQNMRGKMKDGDKITRDGFHLNLNYGRYLAGAAWAAAIAGKDPLQLGASGNQAIDRYLSEIKDSVASAINSPFDITETIR